MLTTLFIMIMNLWVLLSNIFSSEISGIHFLSFKDAEPFGSFLGVILLTFGIRRE